MKGDFSHRALDPHRNFAGVLQQQGRVLLDRDWNDQTSITRHWQDQAGRDVIGPEVAAVPSGGQDGFAITGAAVVGGQVELQVNPGRIWADGIVCYLPDPAPVTRLADYFQPPIQDPAADVSTIADGVRDAVILEVSREELNAFQVPNELLEPALGGPDTTERIQTRTAFKLFRLAEGQDCHSIRDRLDDEGGHLTVQLQPTAVIPGDCPLVLGGGYTGFEHFLYRIEIAALDAGTPAHFKWSRFNGGLVGRGELLATPNRIRITANRPAIVNSGLNAFYCEVLVFDAARGIWNVTYGADVTLVDGELHIATERLGSFAAATDTVFFRLWDAINPVSDFTNAATPVELLDGIRLIFDAPAVASYVPGNYWTFQVRAGEIGNEPVLIDDRAPEGPRYHRVALAEITWGDPVEIEDCRRHFRPLTQLDTCCTYRVGDGVHSHGDFTSIQDAINALPARGGEVCVLAGVFNENITINGRENITISGCGARSLIRSRRSTAPVIHVRGGANITIDSLAIESAPRAGGILLQGADYVAAENAFVPLAGVTLSNLLVLGGLRAAVRASYVTGLTIRGCRLHQRDFTSLEHTVMLRVDDVLIVENLVEVGLRSEALHGEPGGEWAVLPYLGPGSRALGGIHLLGLSERIQIVNNLIRGGSGHGITLGSLRAFGENGEPQPEDPDDPEEQPDDPCEPTHDVPPILIFLPPIDVSIRILPDGPIEELLIARNRIYQMGTCGIGVIGFFDLRALDAFVTVRNLAMLGNDIRGNMRRPVAELPNALLNAAGFGGVSLADVENLVVHDNLIAQNGPTRREAICGIFVLHGEGVDVSRNRILDNGRGEDDDANAQPKPGLRGGIVLVYALAPTRLIRVSGTRVPSGMAPAQNGVPAAKIHDNIVVQPFGPALLMTALGPVSVLDNQLTSQGTSRGFTQSFIAATVSILNLGLSNELYLQYLAFRAAAAASLGQDTPPSRPGFDDLSLGRALANGLVLFANNQVTMDVAETGLTVALSSILIVTLDDLGFQDNQCVANTLDDIVLIQALLFGLSTRVTGNRFAEGYLNAVLSALSLGLFMNTTTDNQGTHCIIALGNRLVRFPNTSLYGGVELGEDQEPVCDRLRTVILRFLVSLLSATASPGVTTVPSHQYQAVNLVKNP
jgi:Family of unknown function (DUF6519)